MGYCTVSILFEIFLRFNLVLPQFLTVFLKSVAGHNLGHKKIEVNFSLGYQVALELIL